MAHVEAFVVVLGCCLLLTEGVLKDLANLRFEEGEIFESYNQLINQSNLSKADYIQGWIHFQDSVKRQAFMNSNSTVFKNQAKYGINQFSNLSPQQFKELYLKAWPDKVAKYNLSKPGLLGAAPLRFDWRDQGAVNPVRNQQSCGACWAFSVVSAIETVIVKNGGKLQDLSVQQVIDCAYKSQGCNGGSTVSTLDWLNQTKEKLVNEVEYPFKATTGVCQIFPQAHGGISVKGYIASDFSEQEEVMKELLVKWGPLIVIVDAISWQDYLGGIIQHHCSSGYANHAVLIIGYDTTGEVPFWIIRNSWGKSWGDEGYAYIKMGENMCGIADCVAAVSL